MPASTERRRAHYAPRSTREEIERLNEWLDDHVPPSWPLVLCPQCGRFTAVVRRHRCRPGYCPETLAPRIVRAAVGGYRDLDGARLANLDQLHPLPDFATPARRLRRQEYVGAEGEFVPGLPV